MSTNETPLSDVRFLTVAEVASIMRVSKMTVYRLVHSGELEAIRVGRSFRVPEQAVNQYLKDSFVAASYRAATGLAYPSPGRLGRLEVSEPGRDGNLGRWRVKKRWRVPPAGGCRVCAACLVVPKSSSEGGVVGSVIKKRRKRMAKKKHRKLLRKTRVQRRNKK